MALSFLGSFQAILDGQPITRFRSSNVQGMLVYLALQGNRPVNRDVLATLFWPDEPADVARTNFRQALYQLRKLLEADKTKKKLFLTVTRQTVQFNPHSDYGVDVQKFHKALDEGDLETAVSLYKGEFLPGFTCDSLEFENWMRQERESLHGVALEAMYKLTARYMRNGRAEEAQTLARQQLSLEPWSERAHQQLIEGLALAGHRTAALAQFEQCCEILADELGVSPTPETMALAQRIETNELRPVDPDLIAGRYTLGEEIGRGAMGIVYQGQDHHTGEPVAIKLLDTAKVGGQHNLVKRFIREGEILQQLNHPNIVQMLATDERDGKYYLVMEHITGGDLRQLLDQESQLPVDRVLTIALDLADALTRAHRLNILHRDLKPANVLIDVNGLPRLTDFGIARLGQESDLTDHGAVLGTLTYISPEACRGEPLDERADLWSFGILLFEMLSGTRPFEEPNLSATLKAILDNPLPDIRQLRPDLPASLAELVNKLLSKDRETRIPSIRLVGAALEALLSGLDIDEQGTPDDWLEATVWTDADDNRFQTELDVAQSQPAAPRRPFQAPPVPPHFVGRAAVLREIETLLTIEEQEIVALVGMGGIGKSSLAAYVTQELQTRFADGVLWGSVNTSETMSILELWGRAYGHDFSGLTDVDSRATAVRTMLSDKQTLIVLDNVDEAAMVRPLLQNGPHCAVLITTRNLDVASALSAQVVQLTELTPESGLALLSGILGAERVAGEEAAAAEICALLHHLPLAVEIAGQRLKSRGRMRLAAMAKRLEDTRQRLGLAISDQAVRASFEVSWEGLTAELQETFAGVALFAGRPFTDGALAAVLDQDLFDTEDQLYTLTALSLVAESGDVRYKQHPLLAWFAAEKLGESPEHQQRFVAYYLDFAQEHQLVAEQLEPEWENLTAAIKAAYELEAWQTVLEFTDALARSWLRYGRYQEAELAYGWGQTAAEQLASKEALAQLLLRWAEINIEQSGYDAAWERLEQSLKLYYELEDDYGVAQVRCFQGSLLFEQGDYKQAERLLLESQEIHANLDGNYGEAKSLYLLAAVYHNSDETRDKAARLAQQAIDLTDSDSQRELRSTIRKIQAQIELNRNNLDQAKQYALEAVELSRMINNPMNELSSTRVLAMIHSNQGNYEIAERLSNKCLDQALHLGNSRLQGMMLDELALIYSETGRYELAQAMTEQSLIIYRQIEDRVGYGYALVDLGKICLRLNQPRKAMEAWEEAQQLAGFLDHSRLKMLTQKYLLQIE